MDKKESEQISIDLANLIAMENPVISVDGLIKALDLERIAGPEYVARLKEESRELDAKAFREDPYIKNIKIEDTKIEMFFLTNASYEAGELFQYDEPDLDADIVVPKLGYFTEKVDFPTIYEAVLPWMSACPSEINSMKDDMDKAHGKVLVLGLGLGYYPYIISQKPEVEEITIVDFEPNIIRLFEEKIFPQFNKRDKIRIVEADAFKFMMDVEPGEYDFIYADVWENQFDGAIAYRKIHEHEERLVGTEFAYWIEKEILCYLETLDEV